MRFALSLFAVLLLGAGPALAQLHERGVARSGSVLRSQTGGMAFTCRAACSVEASCTGWSFRRAGESGPQARCDLLTGAVQARPDACCDSGELSGPPRPAIASSGPPAGENRYADRSQRPSGPPVSLTADLWSSGEDEAEEDEDGQPAENSPAATNVQQAPAPAARMLANEPSRPDGQPHYSVQREYAPAPPVPLHPGQPGSPQPGGVQNSGPAVPAAPSPMANPQRW